MNLYTISFLIIFIFNVVKNKNTLTILQQSLYNENNRYIKWIKNNSIEVFITLDLISTIIIIIAYLLNNSVSEILIIISIILYILEEVRLINKDLTFEKKLVVTKRIKRLIVTLIILYMLPLIIYFQNRDNGLLLILVESIITYLCYFMVLLSKFINKPVEKIIHNYYETEAKMKLEEMTNLKVIGITGSHGKTSSKNILNDILSTKYKTRSTPRNLNTEYSLLLTIKNHLNKSDQIFISEIGSHNLKEIRKQCNLIKPKYAILTSIGTENLDYYGSLENIKKTNFHLIDNLDDDAVAVLNKDDINQINYNIKSKCKKIWISIDNPDSDVYATNIKCDHNGTKFDIIFKGNHTKYSFETKLLGNYNIYNLLASIALGRELGLTIKELQKSVKEVKVVNARLELKDYKYMYQINDTRKSTLSGMKMALDVLKMMPGVKIVVTPGVIDKDNNKTKLNHTLGNHIAKVSDYVILVGNKASRQIFDGLLENGYDKDKIFMVKDINDAYTLIQNFNFNKKIYALFENNLPKRYNKY